MARRNNHSFEEIKGLVLSAAEAIVIEQGGSALTARKIAMRIGYTVGSIYMVFDNMADVVVHINTKTVLKLIQYLQNTQAADLSLLVSAYLAFVVQNHQCWQLWSATQNTENSQNSVEYSDAIDKLTDLIANYLPKSGNPAQNKLVAVTLWMSMQGVCVAFLSVPTKTPQAAKESLALLAKLFMA